MEIEIETKLNYLAYQLERWKFMGFITAVDAVEVYAEAAQGLHEDDTWADTLYLEEEGRAWAEGLGR